MQVRLGLDRRQQAGLLMAVKGLTPQGFVEHIEHKGGAKTQEARLWMALAEGAGKEASQGGFADATGASEQQAAPVTLKKGSQVLPHLPPSANERLALGQMQRAIANEHRRTRPGRQWLGRTVHIHQRAILGAVEQYWQRPLRPGIAMVALGPGWPATTPLAPQPAAPG